MVFVAAREALLDTGVLPEAFHGGQQLLREGLGVVHALAYVEHHLGIALFGLDGEVEWHGNGRVSDCEREWALNGDLPPARYCCTEYLGLASRAILQLMIVLCCCRQPVDIV